MCVSMTTGVLYSLDDFTTAIQHFLSTDTLSNAGLLVTESLSSSLHSTNERSVIIEA